MIGEVLTTSERLRTAASARWRGWWTTPPNALVVQQEMTDMVATAVHEMGLTVQEHRAECRQRGVRVTNRP